MNYCYTHKMFVLCDPIMKTNQGEETLIYVFCFPFVFNSSHGAQQAWLIIGAHSDIGACYLCVSEPLDFRLVILVL